MRRSLIVTVPDTLPDVTGPVRGAAWEAPWTRLVPLWRHGLWLLMLFVVCGLSLSVRLDVRRLERDLDRNASLTHEAEVRGERLRLEWDVRRRSAALEVMARSLSLDATPVVVPVESNR